MFARFIVAATLAIALPAGAANIQPNSFAWGENIGWINFAPTGSGGVTVSNTGITGFAWSENFGWVNFAPTSGGVVNSAGVLSGFAWSENAGWINFLPAGAGGVTINTTTGQFSGFAWGENVGWINFGVTSPVITTWRPNASPGSTGVASRKVHGAAGTFDLPLVLTPANPTTEPRQGPTHTIVFTFDRIVLSGNAAVTEGIATAGAADVQRHRDDGASDRREQRAVRHANREQRRGEATAAPAAPDRCGSASCAATSTRAAS